MDAGPDEKVLLLRSEYTGEELVAHLRDSWYDTPVNPGDAVNIIADIQEEAGVRHAVCSHTEGLLVRIITRAEKYSHTITVRP